MSKNEKTFVVVVRQKGDLLRLTVKAVSKAAARALVANHGQVLNVLDGGGSA